jgi:hypothetical protein
MTGGIIVACIFIVILILGAGAAAILGIELIKGDANKAFWGSLKMLVMFSVLTGIWGFCALTEDGFVGGLKNLARGHYSLFFWITFPGQMITLVILVPAWRKR